MQDSLRSSVELTQFWQGFFALGQYAAGGDLADIRRFEVNPVVEAVLYPSNLHALTLNSIDDLVQPFLAGDQRPNRGDGTALFSAVATLFPQRFDGRAEIFELVAAA